MNRSSAMIGSLFLVTLGLGICITEIHYMGIRQANNPAVQNSVAAAVSGEETDEPKKSVVQNEPASNAADATGQAGEPESADEFLKEHHSTDDASNESGNFVTADQFLMQNSGNTDNSDSTQDASSPQMTHSADSGDDGQSDSQTACNLPYPCRLQTIIDHNDWQPVLSALEFAMQTGAKTKVSWNSKIHNHKGYIVQNGGANAETECKSFKIVSFMGPDTGKEIVTACPVSDGSITVR